MKKRALANVILCLSIFFLPWYISCALAVFFGCIFYSSVELMVWGAIADAVYAPGNHEGFYFGATIAIVSMLIPLVVSRTPWHR
jgi:hypothetical protein